MRPVRPANAGDENGPAEYMPPGRRWSLLIGLFRSRATLEAGNLLLRQQIIVLRAAIRGEQVAIGRN